MILIRIRLRQSFTWQRLVGGARLLLVLGGVVVGFGPEGVRAQSQARSAHVQDSLHARLKQPNLPDSARALTLYNLCWQLRQSDLAASRRYGEQALQLARRSRYWKGELMSLFELSRGALSSQDYLRAEQLAQELVQRASVAPPALVRFRAQGLESIAMVATVQQQPARAAHYYRQELALIHANQEQLIDLLPMTNLGLASAYYTQYQQLETPEGSGGDSLVRQGRRYAREAQRLARRNKVALLEAASLQLQALMLKGQLKPDSAARLMREALTLYRADNATYNEAAALIELAELHLLRRRPAEAVPLAQQGQQLSRLIQDPNGEARAYYLLGEALAALGQGLPAYKAVTTAQRINDSIQTIDNTQALNELQVKFDTERKEGRIKVLTQQQRLSREQVARQRQGLWALGAVLAAVLAGLGIGGALALRLRRNRAELAVRNGELEYARSAQDRLYTIVAHDLRGPLAALQSLAPTLRYYRERNDGVALDEIASEVGQTADHLTRLLDNLLHYAASQAGDLRCTPEQLPAAVLLREVATVYAAAARAQQVNLTVEAPPGLAVWADRTLLLTVMRNLTHNALKVAPKGSVIVLAAAPAANATCCLTITDQGPGVDPEQLAELLGHTGPPLGTRPAAGPERGTGLGLPLVRQLVRQQAGVFHLTSQRGVGTVAYVTLPAVPPGPTLAAASARGAQVAA